ncbi:MAG: hypothetical protein HKN49_12775 [Gammaproteobacteria bacterium]|nr:hypothetical protein [Gammaproteobacteria bacterium]
MNRQITLLVACLCCALANNSSAAGWVEADFSYYNPDWELRESESGLRLSAAYTNAAWSFVATHNSIATQRVNQDVVRLRGLPFSNWNEIWVSRSVGLSDSLALEFSATYQSLNLQGETRSGGGAAVGLNSNWSDRWRTQLRISNFTLEENDWRITGELAYRAQTDAELILRIDDFDEFDFTWYEIGYRFYLR